MVNTRIYGVYKNNIYDIGQNYDDTNLIFIYTTDQSAIDDTFEKVDSSGWYKKLIEKSAVERSVRVIDYVTIDGTGLEVLGQKDTKILVATTDFKVAKQLGLKRIRNGKDYYAKWIDGEKYEIKRKAFEQVYSGHGCVIEKSEDGYYMSWQEKFYTREATYKIPQKLIEKIMLSSQDAYDVATYLRTGEWPTEEIENRSLIGSYLEKTPIVSYKIIQHRRYFTEDELQELLPIAKEIEKKAKFVENCQTILAVIVLVLIFGGIFIASKRTPSVPKIADCMNDTQLQNEIREESIEIIKEEYEEYKNSDIDNKATIDFKFLKRYRDEGLNSVYSVSYDSKVFSFYIKNDEIHLVRVPDIRDFDYSEIEEIIK